MKIGHKTTIYRNLQMLNTTPNGEGHNVSIYIILDKNSKEMEQGVTSTLFIIQDRFYKV